LRAPAGPGIELLEYLSPRDGRPYPVDERANDLIHRQIEFDTDDLASVAIALKDKAARLISSGKVSISSGSFRVAEGIVARDPDGHAIAIVTPH